MFSSSRAERSGKFSAHFITPNYEDDTIQGCRLIGCLELYIQGGRVHRSICTSREQYISSLSIVDVGSPQDHQGRTTGKQHISSLRMVHVESSHRRQDYTTGEQHSSLLRTLHVGSPDNRQDCASGLLSSLCLAVRAVRRSGCRGGHTAGGC